MANLIIQKMRGKSKFAELVGKMWGILYTEGSTPDIGRRRENFIRLALKYELGLSIERAERELGRQLDFYLVEQGKRHAYSFKGTDSHSLKVAWNGNVTPDRLDRFEFTTPILLLYKSRRNPEVSGFYVFEVEDLNRVKAELGNKFWSLPRLETNPRGFGLAGPALNTLLETARQRGNFVKVEFQVIHIDQDTYWSEWYAFMKKTLEVAEQTQPTSADDTQQPFF